MATVLAFVSQKGGSGKTTLAVAVAVAASRAGDEVALIDLEPTEVGVDVESSSRRRSSRSDGWSSAAAEAGD
ncbi:MAG: AAA family ATPase [Acidobacteria bacterium]|nr:AAA family ATPase [Acidobacteriota bacterium]